MKNPMGKCFTNNRVKRDPAPLPFRLKSERLPLKGKWIQCFETGRVFCPPSGGPSFACEGQGGVEPQGIEPWSRETDRVPSTCLVDLRFREWQGYQQPKPLLSYCVLAALSNIARSSFTERHRYTSTRKTKALSDDGRGALSSTLSLSYNL
jgi:hypothetical protein